MKNQPPRALFDSMANIVSQKGCLSDLQKGYRAKEITLAIDFLTAYRGSQGTFNSYRRETERLLHWCALIAKKSLAALKREDIEAFVAFCQRPPDSWVGSSKPARFIIKDGVRTPNPQWRPFIKTASKAEYRRGITADDKPFELSQGSLRELFAILSSFYNYLVQEEYTDINPILLIRQKSKFIRNNQSKPKIRRLSELQWQYVINKAKALADQQPDKHERSLFILSALYAMYLRISELTATERWTPRMNDFARDGDGNWWFTTVGKGNKERQIAVSEAMLSALKRWRNHLNLSPTPSPADNSFLLPKTKSHGGIKSTNYIRNIVQYCFDQAINQLQQDGLGEEAATLNEATVHWLRHTGISDDVKTRPREHVRDDAGHSSGAITDHYIDVELRERHRSARNKKIIEDP